MRRRGFVKALAAVPAAPTLLGQPPARPQAPAMETPKLTATAPDAAAEPVVRFFTKPQFAALQKLSDLLMPASGSTPGALNAQAAEFLDFLISESPAERQHLYRAGLDGLNSQALKQFHKPFAELDEAGAANLLAPLRKPWTYTPPTDPVARFLLAAKVDVRTATLNSAEYSAVAARSGGRRSGGNGLYWYPLV